jgi:hypothetical protein
MRASTAADDHALVVFQNVFEPGGWLKIPFYEGDRIRFFLTYEKPYKRAAFLVAQHDYSGDRDLP